MKYRKLGNTGLIVSEVALGAMQFGTPNFGNIDQEGTAAMVRAALDKGINFVDTADIYGQGESERLLGKVLKGLREEIVLTTKARLPMGTNFNRSGATRVNLIRALEGSLERLQTEYVDLYQIHGWDSSTPLEETLRTLNDVVRQGKARYIGFSNYLSWQAASAIDMQERINLEKYPSAQMYYSLVGRDLEYEFQSFAEYYGIGIVVWSPLAGGFLSGKYHRNQPPPVQTRFAEAGQFIPFDKDRGYRIIDVLKAVAHRTDATPARVALAWVLAKPAVSSVIIGARTLDHLQEDIKAVDLNLPTEDMELLDQVSDPGVPYPKWIVMQHNLAEDPRMRVSRPALFTRGEPWKNLLLKEWTG